MVYKCKIKHYFERKLSTGVKIYNKIKFSTHETYITGMLTNL
jgi:hypothetical protein